ncbi:uncharacterized protein LOC112458841 [Temnothorax curvispinosus]|uniref:Uncharacterized protein LOC112453930 n=1 Tax=Temnothorax curvispinosus TaxID=300111 RepID=A0A6J1Q9T5_9HYME|nr:uncharacterized protein LOC112453930 [Temnothorax curvispinosus]XP_024878423.1 uncharacterized protein LOC112458841 [Temnothorax curvispinosus]
MHPYSRFNEGYHILTVIDVLSKHAWAVPLKGKGGNETADAIAEIIRDSERCSSNLQTDMGKEFYNTDVERLVKKGIGRRAIQSHVKKQHVKDFYAQRKLQVGYTPDWTTKVFKIVKVQHTNPVTYLLEDYRGKSVAGAFYEHELHRATYPDVYFVEKILRRRGDEVYVKWLGFDGPHNSWIHKDNVI